MATCAHCSSNYIPGTLYCDVCGHSLPTLASWPPRSEPAPPEPTPPEPPLEPEGEPEEPDEPEPLASDEEQPEGQPHLRLQLTSGIVIDLGNHQRILIGRKDGSKRPEVDLTPYGGHEQGVSRQHAVITFANERYYIEDLESMNETLLNRDRLHPHQRYPIKHGDYLQFGELVVIVLLRHTAH